MATCAPAPAYDQGPPPEASRATTSSSRAIRRTPAEARRSSRPGRGVRLVSNDGRTYPLSIGSTVIGRGDQANLRLPDVGISRRHARLDYDGAQVVLTDLGSTNGTMVNGQRVSAVALNPGDMVQLGTTTLTFRVDG